jgi:hypothetical protein
MILVVGLGLVILTLNPRFLPSPWSIVKRRLPRPTHSGGALLAELTALGLSAGMSFTAAVQAASSHVSEETGRKVARVLRTGERPDDETVAPLFALADRAVVTGAPLLASIEGHASTMRREERSAAVERTRRLPVKLVFPLALLILPGFLLLTVGPAVLAGIDRLGL